MRPDDQSARAAEPDEAVESFDRESAEALLHALRPAGTVTSGPPDTRAVTVVRYDAADFVGEEAPELLRPRRAKDWGAMAATGLIAATLVFTIGSRFWAERIPPPDPRTAAVQPPSSASGSSAYVVLPTPPTPRRPAEAPRPAGAANRAVPDRPRASPSPERIDQREAVGREILISPGPEAPAAQAMNAPAPPAPSLSVPVQPDAAPVAPRRLLVRRQSADDVLGSVASDGAGPEEEGVGELRSARAQRLASAVDARQIAPPR